ncbi:MAG: SpoIID/LytB domain-containing protein [Actinomycetota bacterium]
MRRALAPLLALAVLLAIPPASAQKKEPPPSRVRFTAAPGESLLVHGEYPPIQSSCVDPTQPLLHARYRGTVEVVRAADGSLSLIGELSFEDYLKGIAEVPRDWPMESLKAQVVAARTYALNRMLAGSGSGDYDLCATTECQVYVGMKVEAGPNGDRWIQAVEETAGEVLLYRGKPAITYYSSTSPGRTFDVEDVFGGEALPYLRGAPESDDHASPLARWQVEMPFEDLARFLAAEGLWGGGAIRGVSATQGSIRLEGGGLASLSKESLRDALNSTASCLAPSRYPTYEKDGYRLPQTVPSRWYRAGQAGNALILRGRGWGHGIGMVQWGAYGKAERGLGYDEILAEYYGGLRPEPTEVPGIIRILIADGLTRLNIVPSAEASVEPDPGRAGPWLVTGGRGVRLRQGERPAPLLEATGFTGPPRARPGQPYPASLTVSDDASVTLEFLGSGDDSAAATPLVLEEEDTSVEVVVPDLAPGRYHVRALVSDGVDVVTTPALPVRVRGAAAPTPTAVHPPTAGTMAAPPDSSEDRGLPWFIGGGLLVALLVGLTLRRGRGLQRP